MKENIRFKGQTHTIEAKQRISEALKGENNPMFGRTHTEKTKEKIRKARLGKKYPKLSMAKKGKPTWNKGKKHSEETKRKISEKAKLRLGNKASNWKGGRMAINLLIRSNSRFLNWRAEVFKRDNYRCNKCGDDKGGNLNAHHIIPLSKILKEFNIKTMEQAINCKELWDIGNGITLCQNCHIKKHNKLTLDVTDNTTSLSEES